RRIHQSGQGDGLDGNRAIRLVEKRAQPPGTALGSLAQRPGDLGRENLRRFAWSEERLDAGRQYYLQILIGNDLDNLSPSGPQEGERIVKSLGFGASNQKNP